MREGTVIARGGLSLRRSPKTGEVVKTLRRGSDVEILGEETWLRVRASDGTTGWVLGDFIEHDPAAAVMPEGAARAAAAGLVDTAPSDVCIIAPYHNVRFVGDEILADADFLPSLDRVNDLAAACGVEIHVTSSFREPDRSPSGAIVPPAKRSNHFVGHAIDMNVKSPSGFFNSEKLRPAKLSALPAEVREFIQKVRDDPVLRWGGDFNPEDPVHIDDGLNKTDPARWQSKFDSLT
jgi:Bacterial SH3 domain/D-alanyl-D-alanine carboxypeptidase